MKINISIPKGIDSLSFNQWITNGIIASVHRKTYFYDQWKKSCRDDNKLGDEELYMRHKNFRFELRKIIKLAKKTFYFKKTWKLINDLRGKSKNNIKAYFIINGEMVQDRRVITKEFNVFFPSIGRNLNTKYTLLLSQMVKKNQGIDSPLF